MTTKVAIFEETGCKVVPKAYTGEADLEARVPRRILGAATARSRAGSERPWCSESLPNIPAMPSPSQRPSWPARSGEDRLGRGLLPAGEDRGGLEPPAVCPSLASSEPIRAGRRRISGLRAATLATRRYALLTA